LYFGLWVEPFLFVKTSLIRPGSVKVILGSHPNHQRYLFPVTQTDTCICSRVALFLYREKSIYKSEVRTQQQTTMFSYIEDLTKRGAQKLSTCLSKSHHSNGLLSGHQLVGVRTSWKP
jgi:hypothetical protein